MTNTQEQIRSLEERAMQIQKGLRQAKVRLKAEREQNNIFSSQKALDVLLQSEVEVSHDYTTLLKEGYWSPLYCPTDRYIRRYRRTIITYNPKRESLMIKEGQRDICYDHEKKWTGDNIYSEKENISANNIEKVREKIGTKTLVTLSQYALRALEIYIQFNLGNHVKITEAVAKLIIRDRTKKGLKGEIRTSDLKHFPYREDKLDATMESLVKYHDKGIRSIPMVGPSTDRRLYYCKDYDVIIDHHFGETWRWKKEGIAILYGTEENVGKLVRLIKDENEACFGPGF